VSAFKRGFKAHAEKISLEVRSELGLDATSPLNPWDLANYLAIPILPLSESSAAQDAINHFLKVEPDAFSALTVFNEAKRIIIHNDAHAKTRQASNIAHEIAHCLLEHPPMPAFDELGCRTYDSNIEEEAKWLTGTLLVPTKAAYAIATRGKTVVEAAQIFGISLEMMQYRLNVTGAYKRIK
jgi:Zn-dependent peptidase ImmA (M78 family)